MLKKNGKFTLRSCDLEDHVNSKLKFSKYTITLINLVRFVVSLMVSERTIILERSSKFDISCIPIEAKMDAQFLSYRGNKGQETKLCCNSVWHFNNIVNINEFWLAKIVILGDFFALFKLYYNIYIYIYIAKLISQVNIKFNRKWDHNGNIEQFLLDFDFYITSIIFLLKLHSSHFLSTRNFLEYWTISACVK